MIALFLIFFSYICYQMLFKRALLLDAQHTQHASFNKEYSRHFHAANQSVKKESFKKAFNNRKPKGFQGGEYIDFEEL